MISSLKLILPLFTILGFGSVFSLLFNMALSPSLLVSTAFIGVVEFLLAMSGYMSQGTMVILYSGIAAFTGAFYFDFSRRNTRVSARHNLTTITYYLLFSCVLALFAWGMKFRSIDEYSFWGIMSKYLFVFNQLPVDNQYINDSFLTYIPGMACFHYLFYAASSQYSQFAGFFAQGITLLAALMVLFDARNIRESLLKIALAYIVLTIGYGTIFARMDVDGYVAGYIFAIFWLIYSLRNHDRLGMLIFFPILFLSLIKEIGMLFAVMSVIAFCITGKFNRRNVIISLLILAGVSSLKWLWVTHTHHYGFHSFARAITLPNALSALNPFNAPFHAVQVLFVKGVFLDNFGHVLAWPNICSYMVIGLIWWLLSRQMEKDKLASAVKLNWIFLGTLLIYLLMLYLLQALVFDVGHSHDQLLDFQRYFNMLLIPFTLFSVLVYFEERGIQQCSTNKKPLAVAIVGLALIFMITGKIERTRRYYLPDTIYPLVASITKELPAQADWTLCLQNPPSPTYKITMPLTFFFIPHKIVVASGAVTQGQCDYVMEWSPSSTTPTALSRVLIN